MKKRILNRLVMLAVLLMASYGLYAATDVVFESTFVDPDTSVVTETFQKASGNVLTQGDGEALGNVLFDATQTNFTLDSDDTNSNQLLFRNSDDETGMCYVDLFNGDIFFNKGMNSIISDYNATPNLPNNADAEVLARNHLKALNMFPPFGLVTHHVGGLGIAVHNEDGTNSNHQKLVFVYFGRVIAGIPVIGSSRIVVGLGADGELASLGKSWVEVNPFPVAASQIVKGVQLKDRIRVQLMEAYPEATEIVVQRIELAYYDDGKGFIEPAGALFGYVIPKGESDQQEFDWIVPLLDAPMGSYPADEMSDVPADPPDETTIAVDPVPVTPIGTSVNGNE